MKKTRFIALGLMVGTLAACTTPRTPAPVVERRPGGSGAVATAPAPETPRAAEGAGSYTVKQGDTLYRIALEFGQSYRDIVAWNKLDNANDIKVGQVLRVQPPGSGAGSAGGAQTGSVASGSGVEVRSLGSAPSAAAAASGDISEAEQRVLHDFAHCGDISVQVDDFPQDFNLLESAQARLQALRQP